MPPNALTATFILNKTRKDRLESVRELNAWGQDVEDLSVLAETPSLEVLALACNNVRSLKQISRCKKLKQLLLRQNQVSDIAEVYHLSKLPDLKVLSLKDNPIAADADYRMKVLAYLPRLEKLDDQLVTPDEVEEAQAAFPDAPHGVSADGGMGSGGPSRKASDAGAGDWDAQPRQTTPGPSPGRSPAVTPPGAPPQQQARTPPRSQTPPPAANGGTPYADGGSQHGGYYSAGPHPGPAQHYGGYDTSPQRQPPPTHMQAPPSPQQMRGAGDYSGAANGAPPPLPQQQYYSPPLQMQPGYAPNGMPQFQGVPQYATSGWAAPPPPHPPSPPPAPQPPQQQPQPAAQAGPSESTSDNIFYAIVALLPELSPKHLLWVKGEVEARLLEVQQQQLNLNG